MSVEGGPDIVNDGLVLYLDGGNTKSYPGSGTTWKDLSGNGNDGTLINGVGYSNTNGGSLTFDGVDDYVDCGNSSLLKFSQNDFSFNIFINFLNPVNTNKAFIQKRTSIVLGYEIHLNSNNKIGSSAAFGYGGESNTTVQFNNWYNIVVLRENSITSLYINGTLDRFSSNTIDASSNNSFVLGRDLLNNRNLDCNISNLSVYNRALTSQEILQNYNATKGRYGL